MSECIDYNTIDAFRYLDKQGRGFVDSMELYQSLKKDIKIGDRVETLQDDLIMFFQKFDKEEARVIKYSSFCDAFAPKEKETLRDLASRVPRNLHLTMRLEEMFSERTLELYRALWVQHFMCE